jgi:hypothetical protein
MPYLGKSPQHGNYSKIDDISSGFDGSDATHAIASNSIAITPVRPEALIISMNGVIQEPDTDYTVSGTNITFTTAPASGDSFFGVVMGEQLAIGTPSDATVTSAKLSGDLQTPGDLTIAGTTPTLTIGDAGAEDTKIVFDGNAQDYYIGLDDTDDDLKIGLGSALGTTTHMAFTEDGEVTKPLQPAFSVLPSSNQLNIAASNGGETFVDIVWGTEVFDIGGDFASNTFTAPVTGKYLLSWQINVYNLDSAVDYYYIYTLTSNRTYRSFWDPDFGQDTPYWAFSGAVVADMDASDTVKMQIYQKGGTAQTDISVISRWTGCLVA